MTWTGRSLDDDIEEEDDDDNESIEPPSDTWRPLSRTPPIPLETIPMSYDPYALIRAQQHREEQLAHAAEHRLGQAARARMHRRPLLRHVGRLFVRVGRALGGDAEPASLQPARSR